MLPNIKKIHIGLTQQDTRCSDSPSKVGEELMAGVPAIETETKFIEIKLQLRAAAMVGA